MKVEAAVRLINDGLIYKPRWRFEASDHEKRFQGHVLVKCWYWAFNSNMDKALEGYPEEIETYATFSFPVVDCDEEQVVFRMLLCLIEIEIHEAREFLRRAESCESFFHPHRIDGMGAWEVHATTCAFSRMLTRADVQFGLA